MAGVGESAVAEGYSPIHTAKCLQGNFFLYIVPMGEKLHGFGEFRTNNSYGEFH
jgi:hypothetical protein